MAKSVLSLPLLSLFLLLLVINSGDILGFGQADQGSWCIAKPSSSDAELSENVKYACSFVNCSLINNGGSCFTPDTPINHASVVMNLYYQKAGSHPWNCVFSYSGLTVTTDPSYGDCKYALGSVGA